MRPRRAEPQDVEALIRLLWDASARIDERDDAAIDLGASADPRAIAALVEFASDPSARDDLVGTCGESIAEIWDRTGSYDPAVIPRLMAPALREIQGWLSVDHPDWDLG